MTFSRVRPAGWTNDLDTIVAAEINGIDINQSRAVDGNAGGVYTPPSMTFTGTAWVFDGAGTLSLATPTTVTGTLDVNNVSTFTGDATHTAAIIRSGVSAYHEERIDDGTLGIVNVTIKASENDVWRQFGVIPAARSITLEDETVKARVKIVRGDNTGAGVLTVLRDNATALVSFPASAFSWAEFMNDGSGANGWKLIAWAGNASPLFLT